MKQRLGMIAAAGLLFTISLITGPARAAEASADKLPENFLGLADERATLNSEITQLEAATKDFELRANDLVSTRSSLDAKQKELAALQSQPAQKPEDAQKLRQLLAQITELQAEIANNNEKLKTLTQKKELLAVKKERLAAVQGKIQSWLSPEQSFKRWMSITFAILIGIVILGFFVISWKDERIRQANLSGQAGIQFLTLFCLVIAIILFGITGILEGRELAALLGGLSGYILGRVTGAAKETAPAA